MAYKSTAFHIKMKLCRFGYAAPFNWKYFAFKSKSCRAWYKAAPTTPILANEWMNESMLSSHTHPGHASGISSCTNYTQTLMCYIMMEHSNAVCECRHTEKSKKIKLINLENRTPAGKHIKTIQNELCVRMRTRIGKAPAERETDMTQEHKMRSSKVEFYIHKCVSVCNAFTRCVGCIEWGSQSPSCSFWKWAWNALKRKVARKILEIVLSCKMYIYKAKKGEK